MNHKYQGMTLVEVLAALALLGVSVETLLWAQTRVIESVKNAEIRSVAAMAAEELIAEWELNEIDVREPDEGAIPGKGWSWHRDSRPRLVTEGVELIEVRLAISRSVETNIETLVEFTWLEVLDESS
jgi:type II secretion system protein I